MQMPSDEPIASDVLDVLKMSDVTDSTVILTCSQLDCKLYVRVNDTIERLGGKWNKKQKAHIFKDDPRPLFIQMLETGMMPPKNPTAYFPTPVSLAQRMAAFIPDSARLILEPSAGTGHIARAIREQCPDAQLDCCEVFPLFQKELQEQGFTLVSSDFIAFRPFRETRGYDAVLMNPPFSLEGDKMAYVTHIMHAWTMVNPGGLLVAIAPNGLTNQDKRIQKLNALVERYGSVEKLASGAFKESGTGVQTVMVVLHKDVEVEEKPTAHSQPEQAQTSEQSDFESHMRSLHDELTALDREAAAIHKQLEQQFEMLFPSKKKPVEKPIEAKDVSQLGLW